MEKILQDGSTKLLQDGDKYYLEYDAGSIVMMMRRLKITPEEAKAIIKNPDLIDDTIIDYQDRRIYGKLLWPEGSKPIFGENDQSAER